MRVFSIVLALFLALTPFAAQATKGLFQEDAILKATTEGDFNAARTALFKGANPDTPDQQGRTPMMRAANAHNFDIMELLLKYNAEIDVTDKLGNTVLYYAADRGDYETVQFLLDHGASPNVQNNQGVTPFMMAAESGDRDVVQLMLDHDATFVLRAYPGRGVMDFARNARGGGMEDFLRRNGAPE
mgnify:CR=1 FL=1